MIDSSRLTDDAFRIGGDEFAVLMPETTLDGVKIAARAARRARWPRRGSETEPSRRPTGWRPPPSATRFSLHDAADRALLAAKRKLRRPQAK